jgi:hypothetical protein
VWRIRMSLGVNLSYTASHSLPGGGGALFHLPILAKG